jgi:hypothetical protein
MQQA